MQGRRTTMAEAPAPQGTSGDAANAPDAAGDAPEAPKTFSQQQVEAMIASRIRNVKKTEADLRAQLADMGRKLSASTDTDDVDEDADPAPKPAASGAAASVADDGTRWRKRIERIRADHDAERKALQVQIEAAEKAHNRTRVEHALMEELSKRGNVRGIPRVLKLTVDDFDVVDGQIVPKGEDATTVSEFFDKWLQTATEYVVGPVSGGGEHSGRLPGPKPAKRVAEMTDAELSKAAVLELFGAKKTR